MYGPIRTQTSSSACEVASSDNPHQSIFRFLYPALGQESGKVTEMTLKKLNDLHRQWVREYPDSIRLKAVETENDNRISGGLLIKVHQANPFAGDQNKPLMTNSATWYLPGCRREHIDQCLAIFNAPREKFMQRPHIYSFIGFAATAMGVPISMRHGFIPYRKVCVEPEATKADDEWRVMERKMQPLRFWPMRRPKGGKFMPRGTRLPWEGDLSRMFSKL
ncbi:hypothetical protein BDW69DRAFT_199649 [Aspergillus filifer]